MNWNRWAAFFCLAGLTAFLPAVFVPAMLVANAVDGPRWYSVWSGIHSFWKSGEHFLAGLIFFFSLVFPLLKFSLGLWCSAGRGFLSPGLRRRIVALTSWTAKYSMLDVMVIAMLVLLVKVNEYVRILPSLGLYLFSAAILLSALAGAALNRALAAEARAGNPSSAKPRRAFLRPAAWMVLLALSTAATWHAAARLRENMGRQVHSVALTRLTHRGELRRSVEKTLALKELLKDEHDIFSRDTMRRLMEFGQAVTTDAGWKEPEAWVTLETADGRLITSAKIKPVDLDDRTLSLNFGLPESVPSGSITVLRLVSNLQLAKIINVPIDEEIIRRADDPFRDWTLTWHGRIFSLELQGGVPPARNRILLQFAAGLSIFLWCAAALLTPGKPEA